MLFFYILLTFLILILAISPTIFNNPVRSVITFVSVFLFTAGILLSINIEFLAFVYAIVYIGAVAVLFLFVVMLLKVSSKYANALNIKSIFLLFFFFFFLTYKLVFTLAKNLSYFNNFKNSDLFSYNNIVEINIFSDKNFSYFSQNELYEISAKFYTLFGMLFIETAFILLIALIGIIVLVKQQPNTIGAGSGIGIGVVCAELIQGVVRNPSYQKHLFVYAVLGFVLYIFDLIDFFDHQSFFDIGSNNVNMGKPIEISANNIIDEYNQKTKVSSLETNEAKIKPYSPWELGAITFVCLVVSGMIYNYLTR